MPGTFLNEPSSTPAARAMYEEDLADDGFVWNLTRLWAHQPDVHRRLYDLLGDAFARSGLAYRQRAILISATASTLGDSYCSLAWGGRLASETDADTAARVLGGDDERLTAQESALAAWARQVAGDPNATTPSDVQHLRDAGLDDDAIFSLTVFIALRIAIATVDDALGAAPDAELVATLPAEVVEAVDYGRPPDAAVSSVTELASPKPDRRATP
jgi:uncharacterized peroxidase-related enzyme